MTIIQSLARILIKHYGKFFSAFLLLAVCFLIIWHRDKPTHFYLIFLAVAIVIWEFILRAVLRLAYGKNYRFAVLNYFLVDDPVYGNAFRKNTKARDLDFLVFDKTVFPVGHAPEPNLSSNQASRNIFSVNSLGYRGEEFAPSQTKAKLRIFCTGGSATAGYCVNDQDTWPAQLQIYLKKRGYNVEVINAGVDGWYSYQELLRFNEEIVNYHADILLIHQGWNEEFEYSSLFLGKKWRPKMIQNVREQNNLYCPPNKLLSSAFFLSIYLAFKAALKAWVFIPNMRFTNPKRWQTLLSNKYILAWFDNLFAMARLAATNNILVYTVNYPALPALNDAEQDREFYINNYRLSEEYANYQAISQKRIKRTLAVIKSIIPCLDVEDEFNNYNTRERLGLFIDELHMSAQGYGLLAQAIGKKLISDKAFQDRYVNDSQISNVDVSPAEVCAAKAALNHNSTYLERLVKEQIAKLSKKMMNVARVNSDIPEDRYTTY